MDPYDITFQTWNKVAALYQEKYMDLDLYNDTYDHFCQLVEKQGARVLEIGCGPGNITRYLTAKQPDFDVLAIDMAPAMIALARENVPTARFQLLNAREVDQLEGPFDAIMCGFCLPYLSREDSVNLFRDCAHLLVSGGVAYFSTIEGDYSKSGYLKASTGDEAYVYYYGENDLVPSLEGAGFAVVNIVRKPFTKTDGTLSTDLILMAQKK